MFKDNIANDASSGVVFHQLDGSNSASIHQIESELCNDVYCLIVCTHGSLSFSLSGAAYQLYEGDICIFTPEKKVADVRASANLNGLIVGGTDRYLHNAIYSVFSAERILSMRRDPVFHLTQMQMKQLQELIEVGMGMISENTSAAPQPSGIEAGQGFLGRSVRALIESVCFYVLHLYSASHASNSADNEKGRAGSNILRKFLISLYYNYLKERSVEFYANQQGLSKRYFSTSVKAESGKSPKQWIEEIVVEEIKHYLAAGNMTIKEISYHFNFPSQSFFGKYFRSSTGLSPKEYRDKIQGTI